MTGTYQSQNLLPAHGEAIHLPGFLKVEEADSLFEVLLRNTPWDQLPVKIFGRTVLQPRLTAFYADQGTAYKYSGLTLTPLEWTSQLKILRMSVEKQSGSIFNSALVNLYRHGEDYMGWHRDNEASLGHNPVIASISLGAVRKFQMRMYGSRENLISLDLANGSLLLMQGASQQNWEHRLPKMSKLSEARINITFRNILSRQADVPGEI